MLHSSGRAGLRRRISTGGVSRKAIGNVLANAAEHGSGAIRVTGRSHHGGVRLQVRNRGRGLVIASEAGEELGGSLSFEIVDDTAVATLDLPAA
jgi:hypothetical protein